MIKKQYLKSKPFCKVTFSLPKKAINGGSEVKLLGEFNGWNKEEGLLMKSTKTDYKAVVELETGREYEFRYLIDNSKWENDWAADGYVPTPFGVENSVVVLETLDVPAPVKKTKTSPKAKTTKKVATKKVVAKKTAKDDLKKIEGIGPKIEQLLNAKSIFTFEDLGKAKITVLRAILKEAGSRFKMHDPSTWAKQAKLAAKGDWEKLTKLQDELNGGKVKK